MFDKGTLRELLSVVHLDNLNTVQMEKDIYQMVFLKKLQEYSDDLVFKGGTSLSKCYKAINRFSEDIDISATRRFTENERRRLFHFICDTGNEMGLALADKENIRSKRFFNKYVFEYDSVSGETDTLIVEVNTYTPVNDIKQFVLDSYIGEYLKEQHIDITDYITEAGSFKMNVQNMEKTLADKIFAVCDYYITGQQTGHSRHIYDIYMLLQKTELDGKFVELFNKVYEERKPVNMCHSAKEGIDIKDILKKIETDTGYKNDYNSRTYKLLYEKVPFVEAIKGIDTIINSPLFKK